MSVSPEWISAVAEAVMALVAICALFYAYRQVDEAKKTREEQTRPYVVCYLEIDANIPNAANLVIKNYGQTAAYNVHVKFDEQPERGEAQGDPIRKILIPKRFPILAPGQEWRTYFDHGINDRAKQELPLLYNGEIKYSDSKEGPKEYSTALVLDYEQFLERIYTESELPVAIKQGFTKIEKQLKSLGEDPKRKPWNPSLSP